MTDTTIPPLTEADVKALGFTRFGREREDDMGGSLAHKDGEAYYMQRTAAFWSIDPEYGNMRNVLCGDGSNGKTWREFREGCEPRLIVDTGDVFLWRVSDLPADRLERMFNHDQIAPVLAGLKAQAESTVKNISETKVTPGDWAGNAPTEPPAPTKRRPLVVGDRVNLGGMDATITAVRHVQEWNGKVMAQVSTQDPAVEQHHWVCESRVDLILPREGE